jgi:hypothetical protein
VKIRLLVDSEFWRGERYGIGAPPDDTDEIFYYIGEANDAMLAGMAEREEDAAVAFCERFLREHPEFKQTRRRDGEGWSWPTKALADTAKKAILAAMKNRPLEDWEQKALAAGWKPPKGRL